MIQHNKSSPYHPQANEIVEAFNKILEIGLTKIILANRDEWDEKIQATLWAYRTMIKIFHKQTSFQLVYGKEAMVPAEHIIPSMFISKATRMKNNVALRERLSQLMELDESKFLPKFH